MVQCSGIFELVVFAMLVKIIRKWVIEIAMPESLCMLRNNSLWIYFFEICSRHAIVTPAVTINTMPNSGKPVGHWLKINFPHIVAKIR